MAFVYEREKQIRCLLEKQKENGDYPIIMGFYESQKEKCCPTKMLRKIHCLHSMIRLSGKSLNNLEEQDFNTIFDKMEGEYSRNTIRDYICMIKQFAQWFDNGRYWPFVSWKKRPSIQTNISSSDILTLSDVEAIVNAAEDPAWKAFIEGLYHSGCRPGEFVSLKRQDIFISDNEVMIRINAGKNNYAKRDVIIVESVPNLRAYVQTLRPEQFLFPQKPYSYFSYKFRKIVKRSGVNKRVWFYLFRHSKYTEVYEAGAKQATRNAQFGHSPNSNIGIANYTHLSERAVRDDLMRIHSNGQTEQGSRTVIIQTCFMSLGANN